MPTWLLVSDARIERVGGILDYVFHEKSYLGF